MLLLAALLALPAPTGEQPAIYRAAGFTKRGAVWKSGNCDGFESNSYMPGSVDTYRDLNGDGRPEAIVTEGGAICYGNTGVHFWLLSKQASGSWMRLYDGLAMPEVLETKGVDDWPDIYMGGPGMCRRVISWDGRAYVPGRFQDADGKPCSLPKWSLHSRRN